MSKTEFRTIPLQPGARIDLPTHQPVDAIALDEHSVIVAIEPTHFDASRSYQLVEARGRDEQIGFLCFVTGGLALVYAPDDNAATRQRIDRIRREVQGGSPSYTAGSASKFPRVDRQTRTQIESAPSGVGKTSAPVDFTLRLFRNDTSEILNIETLKLCAVSSEAPTDLEKHSTVLKKYAAANFELKGIIVGRTHHAAIKSGEGLEWLVLIELPCSAMTFRDGKTVRTARGEPLDLHPGETLTLSLRRLSLEGEIEATVELASQPCEP